MSVNAPPEQILGEKMEGAKRGKKVLKWGFVTMMVLLILPLLFLPVAPIKSGESFEIFFVGTVFFGLFLFMVFGVLARHYSHVEGENLYNVKQEIERLEKDAEGYNRSEEEKNLSREDRELLNSLRQLKRWYQEALVQEQKLKDFQGNKRALEKWYRMGITKTIHIRNLKQEIKELSQERKGLNQKFEKIGIDGGESTMGMKKSACCPKCGSSSVDRGRQEVFPSTFMRETKFSAVKALTTSKEFEIYACMDCGYSEWYIRGKHLGNGEKKSSLNSRDRTRIAPYT